MNATHMPELSHTRTWQRIHLLQTRLDSHAYQNLAQAFTLSYVLALRPPGMSLWRAHLERDGIAFYLSPAATRHVGDIMARYGACACAPPAVALVWVAGYRHRAAKPIGRDSYQGAPCADRVQDAGAGSTRVRSGRCLTLVERHTQAPPSGLLPGSR